MDRRTKIMAGVFGALIVYALISSVVYPTWIKPLLIIDQRIAERQEALEGFQRRQDVVDRAKEEYRQFAARVDSFEDVKVENDVRERLNALIDAHGLADANISRPRTTRDRKTELQRMLITVTAVAKLESAIGFLVDVAELPHLVRVGNLKLSPAGARRQAKTSDRMNVTIPIELMVLPKHKLVGHNKNDELVQPESFVRHQNQDYSLIWKRAPFSEYETLVADAGRNVSVDEGEAVTLHGSARGGDRQYTYQWTPAEGVRDATVTAPELADTSSVGRQEFTLNVTDGGGASAIATVTVTVRPPPPLTASAGRDATVDTGEAFALAGSARGGDGNYTYVWTPSEGLDDANVAEPTVDTSSALEREYTLTVTDGSGASASAAVTVAVGDKVAPQEDRRWKDRSRMQLCMFMLTKAGATHLGEYMVNNTKSNETNYYTVGDEFDGGDLVFVHQTGVLVRRQNEYFVYPIGANLDQDIPVGQAADYSVLLAAANRIRAADDLETPAAQESGQPGAADGEKPEESQDRESDVTGPVEGAETKPVEEKGTETKEAKAEGAAPKKAKKKAKARRRPGRTSSDRNAGKRPVKPSRKPTRP